MATAATGRKQLRALAEAAAAPLPFFLFSALDDDNKERDLKVTLFRLTDYLVSLTALDGRSQRRSTAGPGSPLRQSPFSITFKPPIEVTSLYLSIHPALSIAPRPNCASLRVLQTETARMPPCAFEAVAFNRSGR